MCDWLTHTTSTYASI